MTNNLIIIKDEDLVTNLVDFIKVSSDSSAKICLTSMSHSYEFLKTKLQEQGIKNENIFFLDCITRSLFLNAPDTPDCSFIPIHMQFEDFIEEVSSKLKTKCTPKIFIFDSLSDLKKYWPTNQESYLNLVKSLLPVLSEIGADSYFILYEKDKAECTEQLKSSFDGVYSTFKKDKV
jgi:hypothetical protein